MSVAQLVRLLVVEPAHQGSLRIGTSARIFLDLTSDFLSMVGDVSVDSEALVEGSFGVPSPALTHPNIYTIATMRKAKWNSCTSYLRKAHYYERVL